MSEDKLLRYKTFARKEAHPARIGALGRLYGLEAAAPSRCTLLEIGCGDGGNLLPLAAAYPNSRFTGFDKDAALIEKGQRDIAELQLQNVRLETADVREYRTSGESFDYVICHGVFSWVPSDVREGIVRLGKSVLAPQGLFFLSYNTLPGWRQKGLIRDILGVGASVSGESSAEGRVQDALRLLDLVGLESGASSEGFRAYAREARERLRNSELSYISHEFLGEENAAYLFKDFMMGVHQEGLQFVSESRVVMMSSDDLSQEACALLDSCGEDRIAREQLLDVFRNRAFRETILCHKAIELQHGLSLAAFKELYCVANYIPVSDYSGSYESFDNRFKERGSAREVVTPAGECSELLLMIASLGPRGERIADLCERICSDKGGVERDALSTLATLWRSGFVEVLSEPLVSKRGLEEGIGVSLYARFQADHSQKITSGLHESYTPGVLERQIFRALTHQMTVTELKASLLGYGVEDDISSVLRELYERGFFV